MLGDVGGVIDSLLLIFTIIVVLIMQTEIDSAFLRTFKFLVTIRNRKTKRILCNENDHAEGGGIDEIIPESA